MEFLAYELKAAMAFALFYLFFRLLLSKETLHAFNRFMILASCFIALAIPLCEIKVKHPIMAISLDMLPVIKNFNEQFGVDMQAKASSALLGFENISLALFFVGFFTVLIGTVTSIIQILLIIKNGKKICRENGNILVVCREKIVPMSWMNYIIISEDDYNSDNESILLHEEAHVRFKHSWDILFMELFVAVQWFNPAAWLIRRDLRSVHEYEADKYVIDSGIDAKQYQLLLVKKAVGVSRNSISNSFNHSTLKKRITMMLSKKSSVKSAFKALYLLPLVGLFLACNAKGDVNKEFSMMYVDVKPTFNSTKGGDTGEDSFVYWVFNEIVYPEEAKNNNEQGRVSLSFVVDTDGSVTDVKVLEGVSESLDAEAVRVVSNSPKWTPGYVNGEPVKVKFTFPVIFQLR